MLRLLDTLSLSISIHALVKRATAPLTDKRDRSIISIHALVKRATDCSDHSPIVFNISIHALVKRATLRITMR